MKRRWLIVPLVATVLAMVWIFGNGKVDVFEIKTALGLSTTSPAAKSNSKPICSQVVVPAGECIPQHLARLPPDPGPAGKATIEGVDADKDGVRDDVQRYIAEQWSYSERAQLALNNLARTAQMQIVTGDSVTRERARELSDQIIKAANCFQRSVDEQLRFSNAPEMVRERMLNTPERRERFDKFEHLLIGVYPLDQRSVAEQCGYEPAALPN